MLSSWFRANREYFQSKMTEKGFGVLFGFCNHAHEFRSVFGLLPGNTRVNVYMVLQYLNLLSVCISIYLLQLTVR